MNRLSRYRGRFAPSPTGPLHAGSLVAALASWLDARAHGGTWLLRIEDLDAPRVVPGAAAAIVASLARCGLEADETVEFQSADDAHYRLAFDRLLAAGRVFACACSRRDLAQLGAASGAAGAIYPGTCRAGLAAGAVARAWRFRVDAGPVELLDRAQGHFAQDLAREVGDFVVRRADGPWAYQLAVVVDDARQGITHVVRGADLLDNTPRQIALQSALGLPQPRYLHVPIVRNTHGEKLSKQAGATPLDDKDPRAELQRAATHLGLPDFGATSVPALLRAATRAWAERFGTVDTGAGQQAPPLSPKD